MQLQKDLTIEGVVSLFHIIRVGDKIRLMSNYLLDDEYKSFIIAHKPEIMAYLDEKEAERKAEEERVLEAAKRRDAYLDSVPGLREIERAEYDWSVYKDKFDEAMERGDGFYPELPFPADHLKKLRANYPDAVFVLNIYRESYSLTNAQLHGISKKAMDSLVSGTPIGEVKATYEQDHKDFTVEHAWD